ncbi:MAG: arsenate reductase ArsC [Thermomicrobiales bacterium]
MSESPATIRVLFLCTHNSARSQMAEVLLRHLGGERFDVESAGSEASHIHPFAVAAMEEVGIDISGARSKHLNEFIHQDFDYVITVCDAANESCPIFPGDPQRIHWSFPDPSAVEGSDAHRQQAFSKIRNEITFRLRTWIQLF